MSDRQILFLLLIGLFISSCSSVEKLEKSPIGLINHVSFINSSFDKPNAANGFLVEHNKTTYGITAKHVLMISKTDKMTFVDFEGELKEWKMHPKDDSSSYVIMDQLLNPNRKDSLSWNYLFSNWDTYDDWLVFSVKENKSKHKALRFRDTPLVKGEQVYAIGWSYGDTIGAQRVYEYQYIETEGNYHNLLQLKGPKSLGGLSGAPIVDEKGLVIGLVTSGGEDEGTKKINLQATSIKNMLEFISELD